MEKRLITILSVSLGIALLTIAFLIGRMTAVSKVVSPAPATVNNDAPSFPPVPAFAPAAVPVETIAEAPPVAQSVPQPAATNTVPPPAPRQTPADPPPATRDTVGAGAIADYFAKVDAIHAIGSGDANAFAQQILGGMQGGDMSGFDSLLDSAKLALSQTAALQPPPACAAYHRRLVETLSESTAIMEKVRDVTRSGDLSGIAELSTRIGTLQGKISELEIERKQLTGQ